MRKLGRQSGIGVLEALVIIIALALIVMACLTVKATGDTYINPEYVKYCEEAGAEFGIQPEFLESFIEAESSGVATASNGKCKGLMQVYEEVHRDRMSRMGITNIFDPKSNIRLGASIIVDLYEQYGDDTAKVVMMYNGTKDAKKRLRITTLPITPKRFWGVRRS